MAKDGLAPGVKCPKPPDLRCDPKSGLSGGPGRPRPRKLNDLKAVRRDRPAPRQEGPVAWVSRYCRQARPFESKRGYRRRPFYLAINRIMVSGGCCKRLVTNSKILPDGAS
jgi:hypothetical protein